MRLVGRAEWHRVQQGDEENEWIGESWVPWDKNRKKQSGKNQDHRYTESVMYIPHTPDSQMKKNLQEMENSLGYRTRFRYEEELGQSVASILVTKDPTPMQCGHEDCFSRQWKPGKCHRHGVIYHMVCLECAENEKTSLYIGESGCWAFHRGREHLAA